MVEERDEDGQSDGRFRGRDAVLVLFMGGMALGAWLVSRHSDPDDKRRIHVRLTRAGQTLSARLFDQQTQWIASLFADISTAERQVLGTLLQRVWSRTDAGRTS